MREARRDEPTEQFGPYVLYECLGRGGMATVHRAKKQGIEGFERPVALKRMLPWLSADADFVKSFVREARLAAQLRHTNIAQVYDLGKVDGAYYIAMELVAGRDLREILRHAHNISGPPPVSVAINVLFQVCDALDYAHTFRDEQGRPLGLVHRDISPANIIVGDDGTAKIVDFGVAKGTTNTLATQSGMLKGKFSYMAPEMLQGQVDARSDLFAVGIVAWEMLTAKPLFSGGDDMEVLQRIASWDPPPPSTVNGAVSRDLDAWIAMALHKEPRKRFQSAAQMRAGLELVARTPQMRAGAPDVAGWVAWAMAQSQPVAAEHRADRPGTAPPPMPAAMPAPVPASVPASDARSSTMAVDEAAIEVEILRHPTAVGAAPAPPRTRTPSTAPPPVFTRPSTTPPPLSGVPTPIAVPPSGAVVAPMSSAGSTALPAAAAAASAARTVLHDHGTGPSAVLPVQPAQTLVPIQPAATQMMEPPQAYALPQAYAPPQAYQAYVPATQAMVLPAQPPGAFDVPLSAIAPTISPDAGVVAPHGMHAWQMSPQGPPSQHQPALHGADDLRQRPEYVAATAAYQAAAELISPGFGPGVNPAPRGTPAQMTAAPERRSRQRTASTTTPPPQGSALGTLAILVLCAAAAVGGFFLVQHLM
ncbi:MAG TPA: protein kinase [Kofleriaceae bacterium]|nr:protein kinase [Kofleriaceae bacterium]